MTRDEFLIACYKMGYCSPIQAREYAADRQEFTDDDLKAVYRKYENTGKARALLKNDERERNG